MRFCGSCAAPLSKECPACQGENPAEFLYCGFCGTKLPAENEAALWPQNLEKPDAERRQLSVVFCDLAGSTALSERLDPEDFRDVIAVYREICANVVQRCGGRIARYIGDGLLIYFGYPNAHDDDPKMAVRAALQIISGLRNLPAGLAGGVTELQAHIGIHTGLVVAGDLRSGADREIYAIVGDTPNVAARLQGMAGPDMVFISDATHALVKQHFVCRDLGLHQLRGISKPVRIYAPVAERERLGAREVFEHQALTPLEGRASELAMLTQCWERAKMGRGQAVMISGDAGIGKSRLVFAFQNSIAGEYSFLATSCSPYSTDSAFMPVIDLLQRQLAFGPSDSTADKISKLESGLKQLKLPLSETLPLIALLLSLPFPDTYALPRSSPEAQREKTLEILLLWLLHQAERCPLVLLIEDLHWTDASTLQLITLLLNHVPTSSLLLVLTFRTEHQLHWKTHSYLTHITLSRLSESECDAMVNNLVKDTQLSPALKKQLVERADGVPLFIEELLKAVIESRAHAGDAAETVLDPASIPTTLRDSLMARLDRLNSVKLTVQIASTLGREFSFALLQAVAGLRDAELIQTLSQLVAREILFQRGVPPRASYSFKHALIQEAAYQSLLRTVRRHYHVRAATALVEQFAEIAERQPELVAEHYNLGGEIESAIFYWQAAGERALTRFANVEAITHFKKALAQVTTLPESEDRARRELNLLTNIGNALTAINGYAASEAEHIFARARALCQTVDDAPQLHKTLRGLQSYYQVRGPLRTAREIGEQLFRLTERSDDPSLWIEARRALGWCLFCLGEMRAGRDALTEAVDRYNADPSYRSISPGSDAGVLGNVNLAWAEWCLGDTQQAIRRSQDAIRLAEKVGHPLSLSYALCMSAAIRQGMRQPDAADELARKTLALAAENGFSYWKAWGSIILGWAMAQRGAYDEGRKLLIDGLAAYRATGAELFRPYGLTLLAEIHGQAGRAKEGLACIREAIEHSAAHDVHFFDAETFRIQAGLLSQDKDLSRPVEALERAVEIAVAQGAKTLEARARDDLAALRPSPSK
jgi:class 3 adenylate cyclase/tetratricopeptide (TPR) repeat protein